MPHRSSLRTRSSWLAISPRRSSTFQASSSLVSSSPPRPDQSNRDSPSTGSGVAWRHTRKGCVLAARAVETHKERLCLSREGSGDTQGTGSVLAAKAVGTQHKGSVLARRRQWEHTGQEAVSQPRRQWEHTGQKSGAVTPLLSTAWNFLVLAVHLGRPSSGGAASLSPPAQPCP